LIPKYSTEDTIAAIATPPGRGAIGVIKISGDEAKSIIQAIFKPAKPHKDLEPRRLYYGFIVDPETGERLDEVLVAYMKAPHSYTREDVVEIYAHSGYLNLRKTLELVLRKGARLAEPGEFTLRAFLNGRIDLAQAEAIEEVISAKSEVSLKLALKALEGKLSQRINQLKEAILEMLAHVESAIDFPEEDIEILAPHELKKRLKEEVLAEIERLISAQEEGKVFREGLTLVIAGKPNVGKSSLLNALLKEDRAIVSSIPGTTRDFLEELATIGGLPVRLVDTAGLRETEDPIEKVGVERAWQKVRSEDLVVFLVSAEAEPDEETENIYKEIESLPHLFVINKIDLTPNYASDWEAFAKSRGISPIKISAGKEIGLEELSKAIADKVLTTWAPRFSRGDSLPPCHPEARKCRGTPLFARCDIKEAWGDKQQGAWGDNFVAPNLRQKMALVKAKEGLELALSELEKKEPLPELIAIGLRSALSSLSEITGEATTEDLLNTIFSSFCIGK